MREICGSIEQATDRATRVSGGVGAAAVVVMIASTVVYVRVLIEVAVISREFLGVVAVPIGVLMVLTLIPALTAWFRGRRTEIALFDRDGDGHIQLAAIAAQDASRIATHLKRSNGRACITSKCRLLLGRQVRDR